LLQLQPAKNNATTAITRGLIVTMVLRAIESRKLTRFVSAWGR